MPPRSFGNGEIVRLLLDRGAHVDYVNTSHATALHDACARGDHLTTDLNMSLRVSDEASIVILLLAAGASANVRGQGGVYAQKLAFEMAPSG
jgi:ankyrin repeat protein